MVQHSGFTDMVASSKNRGRKVTSPPPAAGEILHIKATHLGCNTEVTQILPKHSSREFPKTRQVENNSINFHARALHRRAEKGVDMDKAKKSHLHSRNPTKRGTFSKCFILLEEVCGTLLSATWYCQLWKRSNKAASVNAYVCKKPEVQAPSHQYL